MKKFLLSCFLLITAVSTFAQTEPKPAMSPEQLKLRDELEADPTILRVDCRRADTPFNPSFPTAEKIRQENARVREANARIKWELYRAAQTDNLTVKAMKRCGSKEGTPMVFYLLIENGKISYVADYSRDQFGGLKFYQYQCSKLTIGTFTYHKEKGTMIFVPLKDEKNDKPDELTLTLECQTEKRSITF